MLEFCSEFCMDYTAPMVRRVFSRLSRILVLAPSRTAGQLYQANRLSKQY